MTSARDLLPALRLEALKLSRWTRLAIPAAVLTVLFGIVAFLMLVWRDQGRPKVMVNEQVAPIAAAPAKQAPAVGAANTGDRFAIVATPEAGMSAAVATSPGRNPFTLSRMHSLSLGTVRLRLLKTNTRRKRYALNVLAGRRSLVYRDLRTGEPVWIARNRTEPPVRVVASSIGREDISGYWEELDRPAQGTARNRSRP